jgi:catechol-2,3-dioxygenase
VKDLRAFLKKGKDQGLEVRGVADHHFIESIYFRDPNGYVIELTAKLPNYEQVMNDAAGEAHATLEKWQKTKGE